jgi:hypothetical protein
MISFRKSVIVVVDILFVYVFQILKGVSFLINSIVTIRVQTEIPEVARGPQEIMRHSR